MNRREFLTAALGAVAASTACRRRVAREPEGKLLGPSFELGHLLRAPLAPPAPQTTSHAPVVICGGGIAGLSAAWRLLRAGFHDFVLLELEPDPGGTSASGADFPWGAHYVPVPSAENRALVALLTELGVVEGVDDDGRVRCAEEALCRAPQERLFLHGHWYEGLYPHAGASPDDLAQLAAFEADVAAWAGRRDAAGRRAFTLPLAHCSRDPEFTALDRITMAEYLAQHGWHSPRLRWFVDYACRDDYGARVDEVSAWAGLFYFAARVARPGEHAAELLTWPEGNGRLVRHLARAVTPARVRPGRLVLDVAQRGGGAEVRTLDGATGQLEAWTCEQAIVALPSHVARRVVAPLREEPPAYQPRYGSWVVANLHLRGRPKSRGFPGAWDNVLYDSASLGYVVASHQHGRDHGPTTWTWYLPLCGPDPIQVREELLHSGWARWSDAVMADLGRAHLDLAEHVERLDVWRWGHAMVRPDPGLLFSGAREAAARPRGGLHFAHTDLSGMALFEEAQHHGVRAAEEVLRARGVRFESLL